MELQRVAGLDLPAEAGAVEPAEQGQLAGEPRVGQHGDRTDLGDGFAHQHAGQRRPAGKVAGEEPLVTGQPPPTRRAHAWLERHQLVDEQERRSMRQHRSR